MLFYEVRSLASLYVDMTISFPRLEVAHMDGRFIGSSRPVADGAFLSSCCRFSSRIRARGERDNDLFSR